MNSILVFVILQLTSSKKSAITLVAVQAHKE